MNLEGWNGVIVSVFLGGLLSLVIAFLFYKLALSDSRKQHESNVSRMLNQHAEQILFLKTLLLAMEKQFGLKVARDSDGNLTGGFHFAGKVEVGLAGAVAVIAGTSKPPPAD